MQTLSSPVFDAVAQSFEAQKAAQGRRCTEFDLAARRAALDRLGGELLRREGDLLTALRRDLGRCDDESRLIEIAPLHREIAHTRRHLRHWMRPRRVRGGLADFGTSARITAEPKGAALIISPWNYPVSLALGPLVSCLAAGCSAIVKPSELAPACATFLHDLIADCFPPDLVTVVEGDREVATRLLKLPFDHIFFTGSPQVGKEVMAAAALNLASVTLELGGKSPCIVGPGADIEQTAKWIIFGKFSNAGQTCIAPDHLLVHDSVADALRTALIAGITRAYPQGAASSDLAAIISPRHAARLDTMLSEALAGGAYLMTGGEVAGNRIAPTLIGGLPPGCALDQGEIFGPILPLIPFHDIDEVIARINARPKPLALYVFEKDQDLIAQIIRNTSSGAVGVNLTMLQFAHAGLPFGGVNNSGIGAAHGEWGFRAFSHHKPVLTNSFSPAAQMFAPYGARGRRMLLMLRRLSRWF